MISSSSKNDFRIDMPDSDIASTSSSLTEKGHALLRRVRPSNHLPNGIKCGPQLMWDVVDGVALVGAVGLASHYIVPATVTGIVSVANACWEMVTGAQSERPSAAATTTGSATTAPTPVIDACVEYAANTYEGCVNLAKECYGMATESAQEICTLNELANMKTEVRLAADALAQGNAPEGCFQQFLEHTYETCYSKGVECYGLDRMKVANYCAQRFKN